MPPDKQADSRLPGGYNYGLVVPSADDSVGMEFQIRFRYDYYGWILRLRPQQLDNLYMQFCNQKLSEPALLGIQVNLNDGLCYSSDTKVEILTAITAYGPTPSEGGIYHLWRG
ncbi:hypothetical protein AVEN_27191-1 [Araneus ventricosus]|uniref:Uncharacterized protein n=1 Tax=Araneus ventricosus TaxID=182803 RepID=A0A4Y2FLU4_ARAVE|nr:hypothetical protein AVEN_27191-1 [Araneus ventricosus]